MTTESRRAFAIDFKVGESVSIDRGRVVVTVQEKERGGGKIGVRLAFDAEKEIPINKVVAFPSGATQAKKGIQAGK